MDLSELGRRLEICWICRNRLLDGGGDPIYLRNEHHVIPRAYGGADGPTVSLDAAHHDLLHLVANRMMAGSAWEHLLKDMAEDAKQRLLYLSSRVVLAARFTEGDPNKRVIISLSFSQAENSAIKELANFHGVSKESLIRQLLHKEHLRCFPRRRS